jgi:hypothetical protein
VAEQISGPGHAEMSEIHLEYISCCFSRVYKASLLIAENVMRRNERSSQFSRDYSKLFVKSKTFWVKHRQSVRYSMQGGIAAWPCIKAIVVARGQYGTDPITMIRGIPIR